MRGGQWESLGSICTADLRERILGTGPAVDRIVSCWYVMAYNAAGEDSCNTTF
jgi:hypothetical protein